MTKNKNRRNRNKRRRNNSNYVVNRSSRKYNITRYQMRTRPATFGPGTYKLVCTKLFSGRLDVQQEINILNDILATNPEYGRVKPDFKYIKLNGIMVTVMARNISDVGNMTPAYILMNYDGRLTENIRLQDNVKVVPAFLIKDKKIKYNIPKINCYGGVLNNWNSVEDIYGYGDIICQMVAPNNTTNWHIRFDVIITLKGPTNTSEVKEEKFKTIKEEIEDEVEEEEGNLENEETKEEINTEKKAEVKKEENKMEKKEKLINLFKEIEEKESKEKKEKIKKEKEEENELKEKIKELSKLKKELEKVQKKRKLNEKIMEMKEKIKEQKLETMDLRTVFSDNVA